MKVVSWNVEGRLSRFSRAADRGSPEKIVSEIGRLDGSLVILPEAFDGARPIEPSVRSQLDELGYRQEVVAYDETGDRQHQANIDPHIMLLSKLDIVQLQYCRLGDIRTAIMADVASYDGEEITRVFGVHLDDRDESSRLKQVEDLVSYINTSPYPVIVAGDFNAMYKSSLQAKILRNKLIKLGIDFFPHSSTRDILQRLSGMAIGDTMSYLERQASLGSGDPIRRSTITPKMRGREWLPSVPMVQIDHILTSSELKVTDFEVSPDGGSDHRAISAIVAVARQNS